MRSYVYSTHIFIYIKESDSDRFFDLTHSFAKVDVERSSQSLAALSLTLPVIQNISSLYHFTENRKHQDSEYL
jgi:hypothetical protein